MFGRNCSNILESTLSSPDCFFKGLEEPVKFMEWWSHRLGEGLLLHIGRVGYFLKHLGLLCQKMGTPHLHSQFLMYNKPFRFSMSFVNSKLAKLSIFYLIENHGKLHIPCVRVEWTAVDKVWGHGRI